MKETSLNGKLVKSINKAFSDERVDCTKYTASRFGMSGFPDVRGCLHGISFYIEGKMLNQLKGKKPYSISKRDGNLSGCSDVQLERMECLKKAGSVVMMAYYKHFGKKGVYLIPRDLIYSDIEIKALCSGDKKFEKYFCPYIKGQVYDCREVLLKHFLYIYKRNNKLVKKLAKMLKGDN